MDGFRDRAHAGALLAAELQPIAGNWPSPVVLGIPRGGIVVADIVASVLDADLDVLGVEKIGAPWNPEFAVGAVGEDGALWLDEEMESKLDPKWLACAIERERRELAEKLAEVRELHSRIVLAGRAAIVVDDGVATGATVRAALLALEQECPARRVLAVPVGPPETLARLGEVAEEVVCPLRPLFFQAVGAWYERFDQVSRQQVLEVFERRRRDV